MWTALLGGCVGIGAMFFVATVIMVIAMIAMSSNQSAPLSLTEDGAYGLVNKLAAQSWGVALMILPGQACVLGTALIAACLSSEGIRMRLGYVWGHGKWWVVLLAALGTLFPGIVGGQFSNWLFPADSSSLLMFQTMARETQGIDFIAVLVMLSVVPAIAEETLFRGYIQRRLLQRWHPGAAIATSTAFFTLAHFDLQHMLGIIPLGLWLGYLAWRTGALWPGMLCHAAQNIFAVLAMRYGDPSERHITAEMIPTLGITTVAFAAAVLFLQRTNLPRSAPDPAPVCVEPAT